MALNLPKPTPREIGERFRLEKCVPLSVSLPRAASALSLCRRAIRPPAIRWILLQIVRLAMLPPLQRSRCSGLTRFAGPNRNVGHGSYGQVYSGIDTIDGAKVAVKCIQDVFRTTEDAKRTLVRPSTPDQQPAAYSHRRPSAGCDRARTRLSADKNAVVRSARSASCASAATRTSLAAARFCGRRILRDSSTSGSCLRCATGTCAR